MGRIGADGVGRTGFTVRIEERPPGVSAGFDVIADDVLGFAERYGQVDDIGSFQTPGGGLEVGGLGAARRTPACPERDPHGILADFGGKVEVRSIQAGEDEGRGDLADPGGGAGDASIIGADALGSADSERGIDLKSSDRQGKRGDCDSEEGKQGDGGASPGRNF